jgi:CheY-like chemotaxis protein
MKDTTAQFDDIEQGWRLYYEELKSSVRVLVVDDEPVVYEVVEAIFKDVGWQVTISVTAEDAWEIIRQQSFDLLVTDKNLPGMSGVELISKTRAEGISLPALVITGYASVESISNALAAGASDYVTKPFDDIEHIVKRASSIIEKNLLTRLYDRIVKDLTGIISSSGGEKERVQRIGNQLLAAKKALNLRSDLMIVASDNDETAGLSSVFKRAGHSVRVESSKAGALEALSKPDSPLAAVLNLQSEFPADLVAELRQADPMLNVVVTSASPKLVNALAAVEAGASDFFIKAVERTEALEVRVRRAVGNSHKARLYLHLIAILHREVSDVGHNVTTTLMDLLPAYHRAYLQRITETIGDNLPEVDIDISDLFEDTLAPVPGEKRKHRRTSALDVEVWYRLGGSDTEFSRGSLRDISRAGFFLRSSLPLERGSQVEAHLLLRGDSPGTAIKLTGRVVRSELHNPDPEHLSGSGILVTEESQSLLEPLIARLSR